MSQTRPIDEHSMHTRTCGELRRENVGEEVTLTGWVSRRRDHGGLIFCDLRDREGITQLTFDPEHSDGDAFKIAETMRPEWPIKIHGVVRARGEETTNTKLATGEIEVLTDHAEVLNTSVTPPFQIEDGIETSEDTRLRYRYLDLRRPEMMANLRLRSDFTFAIREALHNREFMEVETPSLFKSTPEGARDFIVPSRIQPGNFYALPQSPQLLKQLLMVGGVERYYQVAKCFRDEDLRADRQPEFTQVDIEMSFVDQNDVMSALEEVLADAFGRMGVEMPTPLRRMGHGRVGTVRGNLHRLVARPGGAVHRRFGRKRSDDRGGRRTVYRMDHHDPRSQRHALHHGRHHGGRYADARHAQLDVLGYGSLFRHLLYRAYAHRQQRPVARLHAVHVPARRAAILHDAQPADNLPQSRRIRKGR